MDLGLRLFIVDGRNQQHPQIREFVGMINTVAFVPIDEVGNALQVLWNHIPHPRLVPLLQYFQDCYAFGQIIPNVFPAQRNTLLFTANLWNKFDVTCFSLERSGNPNKSKQSLANKMS